uniref:Beta-glucosidase n=1 Tax=Salix viminalis TaxID=40686 RepID=A0A6N2K6K8_SALVM
MKAGGHSCLSPRAMATKNCFLPTLLLVLRIIVTSNAAAAAPSHSIASLNRSSFPGGFIFGTASSAYQYEGAAAEGGRGPSIWDVYTHRYPGIQPFVTLFHWDLPHALEDEYGGFLSPRIVNDYEDYAQICFREFGDRVKYWITLNEPWSFSIGGYAAGLLAPGRCSDWQGLNCAGGDSGTEPYLAAHYQLLAHAKAVQLYKKKYQKTQKGVIGITLVSQWFVPFSDAKHDQNAAKEALDFMLGWFMDPLTRGHYPHTMRSLVGDRLPKFSQEQSQMIRGSFDFIGLNYYTSNYAAYMPPSNSSNPSYLTDSRVNLSTERHGVSIGPKAASEWLFVYPRGIRDLLLYVKREYNNPLIYITENGIDESNNGSLTLKEALADTTRGRSKCERILCMVAAG